jgi:hypothetical protein
LVRALDLLEYWRREHRRQQRRQERAQEKTEEAPRATDVPLTENIAEGQFNALKTLMTGGGGADASVAKIPEHLREAIRWAEAEKEKRGLT